MGEDGTEWGWSNLQATHLVSKELYQSTCALSALEDGVEREMKQFFDMYFVLKKRWDEMREKQTQIHQQLHNLTSKLLPFFEKAQQVLKASLEQEKGKQRRKKKTSPLSSSTQSRGLSPISKTFSPRLIAEQMFPLRRDRN